MTEAQKVFCNEYLIDLNATRAYKVAYPKIKKDETVRANSSRLLTKDNVKEYIEEKIKVREEKTEIKQEMVLKELASIAFFNIKNIFNADGTLKSIVELDDDTAKAIASVKILQRAGGMKISGGEDLSIEHVPEQTIEIKLNDKKSSLELLGKHLGMFKDTNLNIGISYEDYINKVEDVNEY